LYLRTLEVNVIHKALNKKYRFYFNFSVCRGCCCSLAKDVCCQVEDRLSKAHAGFENSMQRLEKCYSGRLRKTESQSLSLRKKLAPRIARLALESRSLRDFVVHGQ